LKIGFYCVIIIFLTNSCISKSDEKKDTEIETNKKFNDETPNLSYELINQVIEENIKSNKEIYLLLSNRDIITFPLSAIDEDEEDYLGLNKYDSIFSKKDIDYIYKKVTDLRLSRDLDLNQDKILKQNIRIIPNNQFNKYIEKIMSENKRNSFWDEFEKQFGIHAYYSVSYPIFSLDKKTAIISFGHHRGSLCGDGFSAIYQKMNGKWILVEYIINWVS